MVFYHPRLCRSDVNDVTGKWGKRCCGMENLFDLAQHLVDVLAGDDQASLLGFVQLPWVSRFYDF
jgi:hypothetical protein